MAQAMEFTKMHGLGNDFVVFDGVRQCIALTPEQLRAIADRRFGVGCDQILLIEASSRADADFRYRIFNADGGEVEQCGNGARCVARFVHDRGLTTRREMIMDTLGGLIRLRIEDDGEVTVNMGAPRFEPRDVPFDAPARATHYNLDVNNERVDVSVLSMGNPHAVQLVADVDRAPVTTQGPLIEAHARFPKRVNAGYLQIVDRAHARLRVWERGAGETLACGTGACAGAVAGRMRGLLDERVDMTLRGGRLRIRWSGEGEPVFMTGPAVTVFQGRFEKPIEKIS
jgi:diaminopimelate epimerase